MMRRRRPKREIPFSFDSFLDIVANVVGVIIRLILVAWVGARSYTSLMENLPRPAKLPPLPEYKDMADPLEQELAQRRQEMSDAQARLLEQMRKLQQVEEDQRQTKKNLNAVQDSRQNLLKDKSELEKTAAVRDEDAEKAVLTMAEIRDRQKRLLEQLQAEEKQPVVKKSLRYRTPVSRPVENEQIFFECRRGRVTFIDIGSLVKEVRDRFDQAMSDRVQARNFPWPLTGATGAIGSFRLNFIIEPTAGKLDSLLGGGGRFDFSWVVEPVDPRRGETLEHALAAGSQFRNVVDYLDPQRTAITFWIYPDSFPLYRQLRDYLYERKMEVAGRPLPEGHAIAAGRNGTASRGQ